jgi:hypothetical protein
MNDECVFHRMYVVKIIKGSRYDVNASRTCGRDCGPDAFARNATSSFLDTDPGPIWIFLVVMHNQFGPWFVSTPELVEFFPSRDRDFREIVIGTNHEPLTISTKCARPLHSWNLIFNDVT